MYLDQVPAQRKREKGTVIRGVPGGGVPGDPTPRLEVLCSGELGEMGRRREREEGVPILPSPFPPLGLVWYGKDGGPWCIAS